MKYANISLGVFNYKQDIFTYKIPENLNVFIGQKVLVNFINKNVYGYIYSFTDECSLEDKKIKYILETVNDDLYKNDELINLAFWMQEKYYTNFYSCMNTIFPFKEKIKYDYIISLKQDFLIDKKDKILKYILEKNTVLLSQLKDEFRNFKIEKYSEILNIEEIYNTKKINLTVNYIKINEEKLENENLTVTQQKIIDFLKEKDDFESSILEVKENLKITINVINTLIKKNILIKYEKDIFRKLEIEKVQTKKNIILTNDQQNAINTILNTNNNKPFLIHGVTGCGKTEIYINIIKNVLKQNKQVLLLLPEIILADEFVKIIFSTFYESDGEIVSVMHGKLTTLERYEQRIKILNGDIKIIVGTRSAVFAPFKNLGVIIVDEEHSTSYKSEQNPKYCAIEVAKKRINNNILILASATPSVQSYYNAKINNYNLITILNKINNKKSEIEIINMKDELKKGNIGVLSYRLIDEIKLKLKNKEQVILFLNRRGYSTILTCRNCLNTIQCSYCNVTYVYHKFKNKFICHHCGNEKNEIENCNNCGSNFIKYSGVGLQKLEEEIKNIFNDVNVIRMDKDTTKKKNSYSEMLNCFRKEEAQILIGTQMITKGLDFENVTLVGVIAGDSLLNRNDYMSCEITFQQILQVSGRSGRGKKQGKVILQMNDYDSYITNCVKNEDYISFYNREISFRQNMNYPPFGNIFLIVLSHKNEEKLITFINILFKIMNYYNKKKLITVMRPSPLEISKIKNNYRWKIIIKCNDEIIIKQFLIYCLNKAEKYRKDVNINITLNPYFIM